MTPRATHTIRLTVNGEAIERAVEPRRLLVDFLREGLELTGTHAGCEHGVCGACTVLFNGKAQRSCLIFAVQAQGAEIVTVEGLAEGAGRRGRMLLFAAMGPPHLAGPAGRG